MLKHNLIANYLGQGWTALMSLVFVPIYIKYLGIEAYGLIGLFAVLQAWLNLLDMGMKPTLNREMARFTGGAHSPESIRDLLRSTEIIAISIAFLIGLGIWSASGWLASDWLRAEKLPVDVVAQAFSIMGVVTAMRFVEGVYSSCIVGLQKQVQYNIITSGFATLRGFGAVGILMWVSPTLEAFFVWQGIISFLTLGTMAIATYRCLPVGDRAGRFSILALREIGRFAGGMLFITVLALLLTQVDKILLSKLLTLKEYGYYTLASIVAGSLSRLTGPISQAWFPRLSELHANQQLCELVEKYHQGAQLVSVMLGSAAIVLIVFADKVLLLWTQDAELVFYSASLLRILALGNLLNGLLWIPYQTQLAYGWTSLATCCNIVSVLIIVPAIFWVTPRYGAEGAAWAWVSLNAGNILIGINFMYRKILIQEKWRWYGQDVLQPLLAAVAVAITVAWAMPTTLSNPAQLVWLLLASILTLLASSFVAPSIRAALVTQAKLHLKAVV